MKPSLALIAVAALALSACGSDEPEPSEPDEASTSTEAPTEETSPDGLTVGGDLGVTVTAEGTEYWYNVLDVGTATIEGEDYEFEAVEFTVQIDVIAGELSFIEGYAAQIEPTLIDADGTEYEQAVYAPDYTFDGTLTEGDNEVGLIGFEAPASAAEAGTYRIEFQSLTGSDTHEWTY